MNSTKTKRAAAAAVSSPVVHAAPAPQPPPSATRLPFYPGATLVPCEEGIGVAIDWNNFRCPLTGTNEQLYWLNMLGALRLTRATVIPYVRFFFAHVRGTTGCFDLVEPDDSIAWLPAINASHKEWVRNQLEPVRYHGIDAGRHLVSATTFFTNYETVALFRVDIRVAPRAMQVRDPDEDVLTDLWMGELKLCDEELLAENLGTVLPQRPAR